MDKDLARLAASMAAHPTRAPRFILPVESLSGDKSMARVRLCTGRTMDVPTSVLKRIRPMGHMAAGEEKLALAEGEIDTGTDAGRLLAQTAHEILRLSAPRAAEQTPHVQPFDIVAAPSSIKLQFWGTAGTTQVVSYSPPAFHYFKNWSYWLANCFNVEPPQVDAWITGHQDEVLGVTFRVDAAHGTPLGTRYYGAITLNLTLVQQTT